MSPKTRVVYPFPGFIVMLIFYPYALASHPRVVKPTLTPVINNSSDAKQCSTAEACISRLSNSHRFLISK